MIRDDDGSLRVHGVWAQAALATLARGARPTLELGAALATPAMSER
jgi:hypothetical protein